MELEGDTDYRARVRYTAVTGEVSEWSDDSLFKTANSGLSLTNKPGQVYALFKAGTTLETCTQPPVKLVNIVTSNPGYTMVGIGVDGKLYLSSRTKDEWPNVTWSTFNDYTEDKALAFATSHSPRIDYPDKIWIVLNNDKTITVSSNMSPLSLGDDSAVSLVAAGCIPNYVGVVTKQGKVYVYPQGANTYVGSTQFDKDKWTDAGIEIPPGETIVKIIGIAGKSSTYASRNIAILTDLGNVYTVNFDIQWTGGPPAGGTNSSPLLWLSDVASINPLDRSDILGGLSVLKTDGTVWVGFWNDRPSETNAFPQILSWRKISEDTDWITPAYSPLSNGRYWAALKSDGLIYVGGPKSLTYQKLDYGGIVEPRLASFGSLPDVQQGIGEFLPFIIPD